MELWPARRWPQDVLGLGTRQQLQLPGDNPGISEESSAALFLDL